MRVLEVLVVGNRTDAVVGAAIRGIVLTLAPECEQPANPAEVLGYAAPSHRQAVEAWFNEPTRAPIPVGTCLLFREVAL